MATRDLIDALARIILPVGVVLPSLLALLLFDDIALAIRVSNHISILVLFATGYSWGRHTGTNPWKTGLLLPSLCGTMVVIAVLLGG